MTNNLLTVEDVAKLIRIGKYRVYECVHENKIPFLKTGHFIKIPRNN